LVTNQVQGKPVQAVRHYSSKQEVKEDNKQEVKEDSKLDKVLEVHHHYSQEQHKPNKVVREEQAQVYLLV